jgi:endonuclease IV
MSYALGTHVAKISKILDPPNKNRKTMYEAIQVETEVLGLCGAQVFTHGPRGHRRNNMDYAKIKRLSRDVTLSVHSSYPSVAIWKITRKNKNEGNSKRILAHILDQLLSCRKIGAEGLVIHLSRRPISDLVETMTAIEDDLIKAKIPIWLEMISSKAHPDLTYETPEKLNKLTKALKDINPKVWGLCIDTAHVYGSGDDISSSVKQNKWFADLSKETTQKIRQYHLNGTESDFGSGKDKHAIAFAADDNIYHKYKKEPEKSGLYSVIKFCIAKNIPVIMEINRGLEADAIWTINTINDMGG